MKTKRCTNSSCRKVFKVENLACPYCGKKYPRQSIDLRARYAVVLTRVGASRLDVIRVIRKYTGLGLWDAKALVDNVPSLVRTGLKASQAEALRAEIHAADGDAMIVPARRGMKGVFVLPRKAG